MELISLEDFKKASGLKNDALARQAMKGMRLDRINKVYNAETAKDAMAFIEELIKQLNITLEIDEVELNNVPKTGAFLTVSNHPYGGIDAIILLYLLLKSRPDFCVVAHTMLTELEPLRDKFIDAESFDQRRTSSVQELQALLMHLKNGFSAGIFPAGIASTWKGIRQGVNDRSWDKSVIRVVKTANVPVVPIYLHGANGIVFNSLGLLTAKLRRVQLESNLNIENKKPVKIRIGKPITVKEQERFTNLQDYGKFLRAKTYFLGTNIDAGKFFKPNIKLAKPDPIIEETPVEHIKHDISKLKDEEVLFKVKQFETYCAHSERIPHVLREISRLREITFRDVGEGTNHAYDLDQYDIYYKHLFIWDSEQEMIVGSYRLGDGKEIFEKYEQNGFYLNSLFKMRPQFNSILYNSIELGRSFIRKEYQRSASSLFLLWKGILYYLLTHEDYRYLIGPVSISNHFSKLSKHVIIDYVLKNHYDHNLAKFVSPRKKYRYNPIARKADLKSLEIGDLRELDKVIEDLEPRHFKLPVLLKKYLKQNARIISFNVDPKFNSALDGFLVLDLFDVDFATIQTLFKELDNHSIMKRFQGES
jgi:putative hemolysin